MNLSPQNAASPQCRGPTELLADEDTVDLAQVSAATKIRTIRSLRNADRAVTGLAYQLVGAKGLLLSIALNRLAQPSVEANTKGASLVEVDVPAETKSRSFLQDAGPLLLPRRDIGANCISSLSPESCARFVGSPAKSGQNPPPGSVWATDTTSQRRPRGSLPPAKHHCGRARWVLG